MYSPTLAAPSALPFSLQQPPQPALQDLLAAEALYGAGLRRGARVLLADRCEESLARQLEAIVGPLGLVACGDSGSSPQTAGPDPRRVFDIVFDRSTGAHDAQLAGRLRALAQRLRPGGVLMLQQPPAAADDDDVFETGFDRLDTADDPHYGAGVAHADHADHADHVAGSGTADRLAALRISRAMRCAGLSSIRWRAADSFGRHVRRLLDEAGAADDEQPVVPVTVWAQR
jgi:SAM-dependent methyltransferase